MCGTRLCALLPTRVIVGAMVFTACFISYVLRANMSINIIAMVQPMKASSNNSKSIPECVRTDPRYRYRLDEYINKTSKVPNYGPRYSWSSQNQGLVLASYFWGYILTSIPGGLLAERFGPLQTVGISSIAAALFTLVIPFVAPLHYGVVIAARFLVGFLAGVVYPALQCLMSKWAPPAEKGKFMSAFLGGGTLSTVVTWPVLGFVVQGLGWPWAFYIPAAVSLLWCVSWYILIRDTPDKHPHISEKEKEYIISSFGDTIEKTKKFPPYKRMFLCIPFWAYVILHFGSLWGLYLLLTGGPRYMTEVLGFNLRNSGILAALPYLARTIFAFIFGIIGDVIRKKQLCSVTVVRKSFVIFSHIIPGSLLIIQPLSGCNPIPAVIFLTMALGANGACALTNLQNAQDLAPNYAGSIFGIVNCIGASTGFITPMLTGYITRNKSGLKEWRLIFWIGGAVYISCGILYMFFGSGKVQSWNHVEEAGVHSQNAASENTSEPKRK